uniref:Uncharacterized protein n=1 Tax=Arundo donax TaxID=35708 RepID=A0A0A9H4N3_ARUDO
MVLPHGACQCHSILKQWLPKLIGCRRNVSRTILCSGLNCNLKLSCSCCVKGYATLIEPQCPLHIHRILLLLGLCAGLNCGLRAL